MTEIDLEEFLDTFIASVKTSTYEGTHLTPLDFEAEKHKGILSSSWDGDLCVKFVHRNAAEALVERWNEDIDNGGQLTLRGPHPADGSDVEAYLVFKQWR